MRFTVDRGISHEIVRHRVASYAMESTRYCISGDTEIRGMSKKKWTVKQLYEWKSDPKRSGRIKLINVRSVDEDNKTIVPNKISDIIYNGDEKVY